MTAPSQTASRMIAVNTLKSAASTQGGGGRQGDWANVRRWLAGEPLLNRVV